MDDEFLTVEQLCDLFKISRSTVVRLRKKGMPHLQQGRVVRFEKIKVKEWMEKNYK